ncbi:hypothetical protein JCM30471_31840 [Desulfuromonas carbonis]|uniref:RNA recognition motif domain-containing protein n=1 Tax=Desulfuromonas sp. DDH964 TaxID=1823759 RepID=UPI00078EA639|nr:RNA-binding protein [Desulfuromonas sp. DDH964]AMV71347.1 RNA-binding protein [Desulfuromonas sp. DDH964]
MSKDLYVKHLPHEMTEEELRKLFAVAGKVSYVFLVTDPVSGESRNCAYVKMASEAEAKEAINCLDGARLTGTILAVEIARPQTPGGPKGGKRPGAARSSEATTEKRPKPAPGRPAGKSKPAPRGGGSRRR